MPVDNNCNVSEGSDQFAALHAPPGLPPPAWMCVNAPPGLPVPHIPAGSLRACRPIPALPAPVQQDVADNFGIAVGASPAHARGAQPTVCVDDPTSLVAVPREKLDLVCSLLAASQEKVAAVQLCLTEPV